MRNMNHVVQFMLICIGNEVFLRMIVRCFQQFSNLIAFGIIRVSQCIFSPFGY